MAQNTSLSGARPRTHEEWARFWLGLAESKALKAGVEGSAWERHAAVLRPFFLAVPLNPAKIAGERLLTDIDACGRGQARADLFDALEFLYSVAIDPASAESQRKVHLIRGLRGPEEVAGTRDAGGTKRIIDELRLNLRARNYSCRTLDNYVAVIGRYLAAFPGDPREVSAEAIRGYLVDLLEKEGRAARTVNLARASRWPKKPSPTDTFSAAAA
jgi:hypothetical protein